MCGIPVCYVFEHGDILALKILCISGDTSNLLSTTYLSAFYNEMLSFVATAGLIMCKSVVFSNV